MIAIIGAGGHAKCAYECFYLGQKAVRGFFDDDPDKIGQLLISDLKVLGRTDDVCNWKEINEIFIAIGDNRQRLNKYSEYKTENYSFPSAIHSRAHLSEFSVFGEGNFFMGATVVNPGSQIGNCCIINTNATVGHDCILEDGVQISPGVNIAGGCWLEEGVFIGLGAKIAPEVKIGAWSTVGAGAVLLRDLPPYSYSYGVPSRIINKGCKD